MTDSVNLLQQHPRAHLAKNYHLLRCHGYVMVVSWLVCGFIAGLAGQLQPYWRHRLEQQRQQWQTLQPQADRVQQLQQGIQVAQQRQNHIAAISQWHQQLACRWQQLLLTLPNSMTWQQLMITPTTWRMSGQTINPQSLTQWLEQAVDRRIWRIDQQSLSANGQGFYRFEVQLTVLPA